MMTSPAGAVAAPFQNWRTVLPSVLWSGLTVIAVVLISRKLTGAFVRELSAMASCFCVTSGVLVSFAAVVFHYGNNRSDASGQTARAAETPVVVNIALTAPLLMALALLPGNSVAALFYTGGLLLFLLTGIVRLATGSSLLRRQPTMLLSAAFPPTVVTELEWASAESPARPSAAVDEALPDEESVSQRFTRTRTAGGTERIVGSMTVCFAAGQRQATVHLPFAPPLTGSPRVVCEVPDDCAVRLKVAAVHPYGTRIELKRSTGIETAETIELSFTVTAADVHTAAA